MKQSLPVIISLLALVALPAMARAADPAPAPETKTLVMPTTPAPAKPVIPAPALTPAIPAAQTVKIGYVDLARFSTETTFGKKAHDQIQAKGDALKAKVAARQKELEKAKSALEVKLPDLSPKERKTKTRDFEKKIDEYRKFVQNAEKELQELEADLTKKLLDDVERNAALYGRENGLAAVVVKRELLFVGSSVEAMDVTEQLIKLMESKGAGK